MNTKRGWWKIKYALFFIAVDTRVNLKVVQRFKLSLIDRDAFWCYVWLGFILFSIR